jgi:hypothetical protein
VRAFDVGRKPDVNRPMSNIITSANSPFFISSGVTSNGDTVSSGGTEIDRGLRVCGPKDASDPFAGQRAHR